MSMLMLFQTFGLEGSCAILSTIFMSSGRIEPNTMYAFFHSWWFARLMKNYGSGPIHATEPLLMIGQAYVGIFLNVVPGVPVFLELVQKEGQNESEKFTKVEL
jgi:hypothetical protein